MSICRQNLMMSGGEWRLRLLMVVLSVLLHMVMNVWHHRRRLSVVWALVHGLRLNLNWLLFRLDNGQRGGSVVPDVTITIRVMMVMMMQVGIVHRVEVAHFNVLVEVTDVWQLLLANVALINDVVGSRGRWQDRDGTILSVLSILFLMR